MAGFVTDSSGDAGNNARTALGLGTINVALNPRESKLKIEGSIGSGTDTQDWYSIRANNDGVLLFFGKSDEPLTGSILNSKSSVLDLYPARSWDGKTIAAAAEVKAGTYYLKLEVPSDGESTGYNLNYALVDKKYFESGGNLWYSNTLEELSAISNESFSFLGSSNSRTITAKQSGQLIGADAFIDNQYNIWGSSAAQALRTDLYTVEVASNRVMRLTFSDLEQNGWNEVTQKSAWTSYNLTIYKIELSPSEDTNDDGLITDNEQTTYSRYVTSKWFSSDYQASSGSVSFDFKLSKGTYAFEVSSDGVNSGYWDNDKNSWVSTKEAADYTLTVKNVRVGLKENDLRDLGELSKSASEGGSIKIDKAAQIDGGLQAGVATTYTLKAKTDGLLLIRGDSTETIKLSLAQGDVSIAEVGATQTQWWNQQDQFQGAFLVEAGTTYTLSLTADAETDFDMQYILTDERFAETLGGAWVSSSFRMDLVEGTTNFGTILDSQGKSIKASDSGLLVNESAFYQEGTQIYSDLTSGDGYRFSLASTAATQLSFTNDSDAYGNFSVSIYRIKNQASYDTNNNGRIDSDEQMVTRKYVANTWVGVQSGETFQWSKSLAKGEYVIEISGYETSYFKSITDPDGNEVGENISIAQAYTIGVTASRVNITPVFDLGTLKLVDQGETLAAGEVVSGLLAKGETREIAFSLETRSALLVLGEATESLEFKIVNSAGKEVTYKQRDWLGEDNFGASSQLAKGNYKLVISGADDDAQYKIQVGVAKAELLDSGSQSWFQNLKQLKDASEFLGVIDPNGTEIELLGQLGSIGEVFTSDGVQDGSWSIARSLSTDVYSFTLSSDSKVLSTFSLLNDMYSSASISLSKMKVNRGVDSNRDRKITDDERSVSQDYLYNWWTNSNTLGEKSMVLGKGTYLIEVSGESASGYDWETGTHKRSLSEYKLTLSAYRAIDGADSVSDTLKGTSGQDYLDGRGGDDRLFGGRGNDILDGGEGNDTLNGETGFDIAYYGDRSESITVRLKSGTVEVGGGELDKLVSIEGIVTGSGDDIVVAATVGSVIETGSGNDSITGSTRNDVIDAGKGSDTINGGGGFDVLSFESSTEAVSLDVGAGTASFESGEQDTFKSVEAFLLSDLDDTFVGSQRADIVFGGLGADSIDLGNDIFADVVVLESVEDSGTSTESRDTITNFKSNDVIDLSSIDFNEKTDVIDAVTSLSSRALKNGIWVSKSGGNVIISGDVDGDAVADFQLELVGVSSVILTNFNFESA